MDENYFLSLFDGSQVWTYLMRLTNLSTWSLFWHKQKNKTKYRMYIEYQGVNRMLEFVLRI